MSGFHAQRAATIPSFEDRRWPPQLQLLLGPGATGLLGSVAEAVGGTLVEHKPRQVTHRGRSSTVQYRAHIGWRDGRTTTETFVAATGDHVPAAGAALFHDGSTEVAVWRWPDDPFLPGLRDALDPAKVGRLLDELGIDGGALQLRSRAYRPGRRAVVEASGRRGRLFLKVVRPDRVEALHSRHRALLSHLPVPDSLGWSNDGVLVLTAVPGQTLRSALRSAHAVPPPQHVTALLDRLPSDLGREERPRDLLASVRDRARVISETVPDVQHKVEAIVAALAADSGGDPGPITGIHGDLYEAQLMVDRGRINGLLDIDTAGAGYRVDDLANFCAHLSVLAQMSDRPRHIKRYGAGLLAHAETLYPRTVLRRRIAAALLGLATGPFRVLEPDWDTNTSRRLDLALEWLEGAGR